MKASCRCSAIDNPRLPYARLSAQHVRLPPDLTTRTDMADRKSPLAGARYERDADRPESEASNQGDKGRHVSPGSAFVIIVTVCMTGPYVLGVRPKSRRDWILIVGRFSV